MDFAGRGNGVPRSVIRFSDGKLLFVGGKVAHSDNCCCNQCTCEALWVQIGDVCSECQDTDYAGSFITPRQVKLSMSGVTAGANTGCSYYNDNPGGQAFWSGFGLLSNPTCETTTAVADNPDFFNVDLTLDPCTGPTYLWECRYKCSTTSFVNGFPGVNVDYYEYNHLEVAFLHSLAFNIEAKLTSYVAAVQQPSAGSICTNIATYQNADKRLSNGSGLDNFLSNTLLSRRTTTFAWSISPGTRPNWTYHPSYCTTECNFVVQFQ